jgi:hypothetical protein
MTITPAPSYTLPDHIAAGLRYCDEHGVEVPPSLYLRAQRVGAIKAAGDLAAIGAQYHDAITSALVTYMEGGSIVPSRNAFRRAMVEALGGAFDLGWTDGGGELPASGDALEWLNARVEAEFGHIGTLFQQAKELRKDPEADWFKWVSDRADGYVRTTTDAYNMGKMYAAGNKMLTFDGPDGDKDNICQSTNGTCVQLKGQRHRASWWLARNLVPYRGNTSMDCGGWECEHFLRTDEGERFTV